MNFLRRLFRRGVGFPAHLRGVKPVDSSGLVAGDTSWMPDPCECKGDGHAPWCRRWVVKPTPKRDNAAASPVFDSRTMKIDGVPWEIFLRRTAEQRDMMSARQGLAEGGNHQRIARMDAREVRITSALGLGYDQSTHTMNGVPVETILRRYGRMGMAVERLEMACTIEDVAKGRCPKDEN